MEQQRLITLKNVSKSFDGVTVLNPAGAFRLRQNDHPAHHRRF